MDGELMNERLTAAYLGALIGGGIIWVLEEFVFSSGAPGIVSDLVDWLAPLLAALFLVWLASLGIAAHNGKHEGPPPPPEGPRAAT
jgi:hypothetical protein